MLEGQRRDVHVGAREADVGIPEERSGEPLERFVAVGRNAAIGGSPVVEIFIAHVDAGVLPRDDRGRGVDPVALEIDVMAEAVAVLVKGIEPNARAGAQRLVDIAVQSETAKAIARGDHLPRGAEARPLEYAIDDSAAAAAAEDHRVGALQNLDPIDIIEVAEILDVVAHSVDEEIGGARIAPKHDLVAVAFA